MLHNIDTVNSSEEEIELYFHCSLCLDFLPEGVSPEDYSLLQVGWTNKGIQVWCRRHNRNIVHLVLTNV